METLQTIWFFLIGFLFIGYTVLDGFDLGMGSLLPFLSKNEKDTQVLFNTIGPVWDGNEVWLITAGGALFAAFPHVYATVFSGFYLALMLILFALIFRAVSLEFWSLDEKKRNLWKWTFTFGSLLPPFLFGIALGNVILGIPLNEKMDFTGNFFTLLHPFTISIGLLGLTAILMQGTTFTALKTEGDIQLKAQNLSSKIWIIYIIMLIASFILSVIYLPGILGNIGAWISTAVTVAGLVLLFMSLRKKEDKKTFIMSSLSILGLWGIAASLQFPNLVKASNDINLNLTIYNSSSSTLTLTVMLIIALIGMPIVIGYTVYVYKIFKGKVKS